MKNVIAGLVDAVAEDMRSIVETGQYPVVVLLRAYDLLELLQDMQLGRDGKLLQDIGSKLSGHKNGLEQSGELSGERRLAEAVGKFREVYDRDGERLLQVLDPQVISQKAQGYLRPWQRRYEKANGEYRKAVELHEAAKVAHQAQLEGGLMERFRTLRAVRKLAGFRLERKRTGNYVARTLELMQQAMFVAREAELAMYSHNIEYKCNPKVYEKLNDLLNSLLK